jgi:hypothetical protein
MKRQPLSSTSLKDLLEQDKAAEDAEKLQTNAAIKKSEIVINKTDNRSPITEIINPNSDISKSITEKGNRKSVTQRKVSGKIKKQKTEIVSMQSATGNKLRKDKADFQKVSFTLDPSMLWLLEDERRRRRVAKLDYSFSEIIREALDDFFKKLCRKVS